MCASEIHWENKDNCVVLDWKSEYPHILAPNTLGEKEIMRFSDVLFQSTVYMTCIIFGEQMSVLYLISLDICFDTYFVNLSIHV